MSQGGVTVACMGVSFGLFAGFTALKQCACSKTETNEQIKSEAEIKENSPNNNHTFGNK